MAHPRFLLNPASIVNLEMFKFALKNNIPYNIYDCISNSFEIAEYIITEHSDKLDWGEVSWRNKNLSEGLLTKHSDKLNWYNVSCNENLSEEFMTKHSDKINLNHVLKYHKLTDKFIKNIKIN